MIWVIEWRDEKARLARNEWKYCATGDSRQEAREWAAKWNADEPGKYRIRKYVRAE